MRPQNPLRRFGFSSEAADPRPRPSSRRESPESGIGRYPLSSREWNAQRQLPLDEIMKARKIQRAAVGRASAVLSLVQRVLRFPYPNFVDLVEDGVYSRWVTGLIFSVVLLYAWLVMAGVARPH